MAAVAIAPSADVTAAPTMLGWIGGTLRRHPTAIAGGVVLLVMVAIAILAPWLGTTDPLAVVPTRRLKPPSEQFWFGTDMLGRDVYSRVIYGSRCR